MTRELTDHTGAAVTVELNIADPVSSYTVSFADADAEPLGRADFHESPTAAERIFFHTEVLPEFGGRGLGGLLVREALADSIRDRVTVVPVCALFARHLRRHSEEFRADGGTYRAVTPEDVALVERVAADGARERE